MRISDWSSDVCSSDLTTKTSVHGAINMLGLAKRLRAKILQASTSEVYGDPEIHPQQESYWGRVNPIGLRACYDEGTRCADRKSVVEGNSGSVRVDLGGSRTLNKEQKKIR